MTDDKRSQIQLDLARTRRASPLVLVVDDEPDARDLYSLYLRYAGIQADTASNGLEAVAKAADRLPDLIVMDLMMPGLTGIEATKRLRADAKTHGIRIVAVTASHDVTTHRAALDAGCESVLTKPCAPEKLAAEIYRVLGR